jgi:hypothetical protein
MPGRTGFDFNGSSQSFNVLASYLFGKVIYLFLLVMCLEFICVSHCVINCLN